MSAARLKDVRVVVWLNDFPHNAAQRTVFEDYMSHGGAWLGYHVSAYNDESTGWPWFVKFLGGAVFYGNNWPPLPAVLDVDAPGDPVTRAAARRLTPRRTSGTSGSPARARIPTCACCSLSIQKIIR